MANSIFTLGDAVVGFAQSAAMSAPGLQSINLGSAALNLGFYHGFICSLPFSAPILICIYRFLVEGFLPGSLAVAGTVLGQICFLSFIFVSPRPLIQFWYTAEPFLALIGFAISFKLAADFFSGSGGNRAGIGLNLRSERGNLLFTESAFQMTALTIFGLNFLLMFLNPPMAATSTRILLSEPLFVELASGGNAIVYNLGFLLVCSLSLGIFWPLVFSGLIQFINTGKNVGSTYLTQLIATLKGLPTGGSNIPMQRGSYTAIIQPRFLSFLMVGCLISGGLQYSWRLFTQYPLEAVITSAGYSTSYSAREFPSFDSNIRHRDKNLPVDRHVPIEKMNARRTLSGRPPLNEEQKSDAYFKFNSFFVNNLEQKFENQLIRFRGQLIGGSKQISNEFASNSSILRSFDEIDYLQKLKTQFESSNSLDSVLGKLPEARPLENNTKGKPKFSYIRELIGTSGSRVKLAEYEKSNPNPLLHDELQIYGALLS